MKNLIKVLFLCVVYLQLPLACNAKKDLILCNGRSSDYNIVVLNKDNLNGQKAAKVLQKNLTTTCGVKIPITYSQGSRSIVLCNAKQIKGGIYDKIKSGGFAIQANGEKVIISGKGTAGILNGVYYFLKEVVGINMLAPGVFVFPTSKAIAIPSNLNIISNPAFLLRDINNNIALNDEYGSWHLLNNMKKNPEWGILYHTFFKLIPPSLYYKTHPEYFSYNGGKRINNGQLCLSNPDVVKIVVQRLRKMMNEKAAATFWFVAQEDNNRFCQCSKCKAGYEKYGGISGLLLEFINKVASNFPDKKIITFAYNRTQAPPTANIKARNNVVICYAPINASHTFSYSKNPKLVTQVKAWKNIAPELMFWDYWVNFSEILMPYPNIYTLQKDIQFFKQNGVQYVYEEGINKKGGFLKELKTYLIAELLWNPDIDVEKTITFFASNYYGNAAPQVIALIKLLRNNAVNSGVALKAGGNKVYLDSYLKPRELNQYDLLLKEAEQKVRTADVYFDRIETLRASIDYYYLLYYKEGKLKLNALEIADRKNRILRVYNAGKIEKVKNYKNASFKSFIESFK